MTAAPPAECFRKCRRSVIPSMWGSPIGLATCDSAGSVGTVGSAAPCARPDMPITDTGTNHNQFANSILLGGKGIRSGLVVGASDLADEKAVPSKAHLAMDPVLEKVMGRPIDLEDPARCGPTSPTAFDIESYLTIGSVVNTIYAMFSVPKSHYRSTGRNLPQAPVLNGLLA